MANLGCILLGQPDVHQHTLIFSAMMSGSSQMDSMKNTWNKEDQSKGNKLSSLPCLPCCHILHVLPHHSPVSPATTYYMSYLTTPLSPLLSHTTSPLLQSVIVITWHSLPYSGKLSQIGGKYDFCKLLPIAHLLMLPKDATLPNFAAREQWLTVHWMSQFHHACSGFNNNVLLGSEVRVVTCT